MAEIGKPERVVRRERETGPAIAPTTPSTRPEFEPAK